MNYNNLTKADLIKGNKSLFKSRKEWIDRALDLEETYSWKVNLLANTLIFIGGMLAVILLILFRFIIMEGGV